MGSISPETTLDAQHLLYLSGVNEVSFEHGNDFSKTDPWYHQMENLDQYAFDQDSKNDTEHPSAISEQCDQKRESYPGSNSSNTELLDPPKPARTAMMCFALSKSNDRDESKIDIAALADEYAALSKDEKLYWEEESRKDKERYRLEMEQRSGEYKMPKRRAKKHPMAPKRPMSAFLKYSKDKRKEVKEANPDLNNTDISRLLGQMWNQASEEEKKPYVTEELTARAAYKCAIAKFRVSQRNQEMEAIRNASEARKVQVINSAQTWDGVTPSRSNISHNNVREVTPVDIAEGRGYFANENNHFNHSMPPLPKLDRNHGPDVRERDSGTVPHPDTRQTYHHYYENDFRYSYPPPPSQYSYPERYEPYHHHGYYTNNGSRRNYTTPGPHYEHGNEGGYYREDYYSHHQPYHKEQRCYDDVSDHRSLSPNRVTVIKSEATSNAYEYEHPQHADNRHHDYYYAHVYNQDYNPPHWDQKENARSYHTPKQHDDDRTHGI